MFGLTYRETLHGGFYLLSDPVDERPADLELDVQATSVVGFAQSGSAKLAGEVTFGRFADHVRAEGTFIVDTAERRASYELHFTGNDGARYRFRGHKELSWLNFVDSFTLVRGSVFDATGREIGRATVRFDARGNWGSLLRSVRVS